jgi:hypothetical protein
MCDEEHKAWKTPFPDRDGQSSGGATGYIKRSGVTR